ncbi:hypothetical protein SLEP1_g50349 [Rubroshorea leprosula]|uniref:Uncharacterized protein n=1 Tax=Rubroshorea leprosula TaxID=152421 RepID=A0AAV5M343_9ROSI|nr:hypothetical protein SLEP1_g50349 [Rubroshorea leprosula]
MDRKLFFFWSLVQGLWSDGWAEHAQNGLQKGRETACRSRAHDLVAEEGRKVSCRGRVQSRLQQAGGAEVQDQVQQARGVEGCIIGLQQAKGAGSVQSSA